LLVWDAMAVSIIGNSTGHSVYEDAATGIKIYPNPLSGVLTISFSGYGIF